MEAKSGSEESREQATATCAKDLHNTIPPSEDVIFVNCKEDCNAERSRLLSQNGRLPSRLSAAAAADSHNLTTAPGELKSTGQLVSHGSIELESGVKPNCGRLEELKPSQLETGSTLVSQGAAGYVSNQQCRRPFQPSRVGGLTATLPAGGSSQSLRSFCFRPIADIGVRRHVHAMRLLILSLLLAACSAQPAGSARFDRERWAKADLTGRERAEMMPSLLRDHPLKGMTRAEVVNLLGQPTITDTKTQMVYVLGNDGSYTPIDNEWLLIDLDGQARVTAFHQSVD